jgi:hypothetical protein
MVRDNLIRGITDEEFVKEVLNNLDTECTLAKVSGLLVSEDRVRSRPLSHIRKQQQDGQVRAVPRQYNKCRTTHMEFRSGGKCQAYNTK